MRRLMHALTLALVFAGLVFGPTPAQAAAKPGVSISKSTVATPPYGAATTIVPKYRKGPRTKVLSAQVVVTGTAISGRPVRAAGRSVRVTAGRYTVTTKVTYKIKKKKTTKKWSRTKGSSRSFSHAIGQGAKNCATMADYNAIVVGTDDFYGSFKPEVQALMAQVGHSYGLVTLEDMYSFFSNKGDVETADYVAHLQEVYGEDALVESVDYKMCNSSKMVDVLYVSWISSDYGAIDEAIFKQIL